MKRECDVGYGKPPTHSRFMTGQSGNPKGRPKGSRNFSTDVKATLEEPIRVTHHGKAKTVSTQLAALLRLREKALSGDARALDRLVELARLYNDDDEMAEAATRLDAADTEIVKAHDEKVLRQAGMAQKPHTAHGSVGRTIKSNGEAGRERTVTAASYIELDAILRSDLCLFVRKVFATVSPNDAFKPNWHIDAIAHELTRCHAGENRRLLITQPPRSLKSICASVAFPAWALGHDPTLRIMCVSYGEGLAHEFARQFRMVTDSEWYRRVFPRMHLKTETRTEAVTTRGGGRVALSVGGSITGRGADFIIIDDPLKAEDSASETARTRVIDWYDGTLSTRLNDKELGVIILVMQRLHQDDLAGFVIERGGWLELSLPAIAPVDQEVPVAPDELHYRKAGSILHPERESGKTLERIKDEIGSLQFSAQYQQSPVPPEGNLIRRDWLKTYDTAPTRAPGVRIVQSWDIATTTDERNDWSVCTTWAIRQKVFYLLDVWRARVEFPALRRQIVNHALAHQAQTVLIEKAGPRLQPVQELRNDPTPGFPKPIGIVPEGDKWMRMEAQTPRFEAGHVLLPKKAPWLATFLDELLAFPRGRHDDQVDSVSQFLKWAWTHSQRSRVSFSAPILFTYEDEFMGQPFP